MMTRTRGSLVYLLATEVSSTWGKRIGDDRHGSEQEQERKVILVAGTRAPPPPYENHINDSKSDIIPTFIILNNTCE